MSHSISTTVKTDDTNCTLVSGLAKILKGSLYHGPKDAALINGFHVYEKMGLIPFPFEVVK